jgi:hypothetical protein
MCRAFIMCRRLLSPDLLLTTTLFMVLLSHLLQVLLPLHQHLILLLLPMHHALTLVLVPVLVQVLVSLLVVRIRTW